ncbi:MAG: TonB-dependent receptor [Deltaproteobacteria bacterium]|nr:TonB-dependent receptor [Deltaproteobacteria bacterium]
MDIHGVEAELQWKPREDVTLFGNYTYTFSEIGKDKTNAPLEGNFLPNVPIHKFHFGVNYKNPKYVSVTAIANFYADMYYDNENTIPPGDYWTVDVAVSRKFLDRFTLYFNAENIFKKKYALFRSLSTGDTIAPRCHRRGRGKS